MAHGWRNTTIIVVLSVFFFSCVFSFIHFFGSTTSQAQSILAIKGHTIYDSTMNFQNLSIDYRFYSSPIQQPDQICKDKRVLIVVATAADNFEIRNAIRDSWAKKDNMPNDYLVLHIIGAQTNNVTEQRLYEEDMLYGDLIRYDLADTYRNLTLKTYAIFDWQQKFCSNVQYVIKIDDDVAVDFKRLDHFLHLELDSIAQKNNNKIFFCSTILHAAPHRFWFSKWYVSQDEYKNNYYPPYCSGPFYMMTAETAKLIFEAAKQLKHLPFEDVFFTGLARVKAGVKIYDPQLFYLFPKKFLYYFNDECTDGPNSVPRIASIDQPNRQKMREAYEKLSKMTCT